MILKIKRKKERDKKDSSKGDKIEDGQRISNIQIIHFLEKEIKQGSKTNIKYNLRSFYWIIKKSLQLHVKNIPNIWECKPRMTNIKAYFNKIIRLLRKKILWASRQKDQMM